MSVKPLRALCLAAVALPLLGQVQAKDTTTFEYQNCADQTGGLPLAQCAKLLISHDLDYVQVRDTWERGISSDKSAGDFKVLNSASLPIAVKTAGYEGSESWSYGGNRYLKAQKGVKRYFSDKLLDVVVVVKESPDEKISSPNDFYVQKNARLTFLYSPRAGVVAIAFPSQGETGDVFYCTKAPCLFADK